MKSYYEILGVSEDATASQLDIRYHVLINAASKEEAPGGTRTRLLAEAYKVLSNEILRRQYDEFLHPKLTASKDEPASTQDQPPVAPPSQIKGSGVTDSTEPTGTPSLRIPQVKPTLPTFNHQKPETVRPEPVVKMIDMSVSQAAALNANIESTRDNKTASGKSYLWLIPAAMVVMAIVIFATGNPEANNAKETEQVVAAPAQTSQKTVPAPPTQEKPVEVGPTPQQLAALESTCVEFGKARDNEELEKCEGQVFRSKKSSALAKKNRDLIDFQWSTFDVDKRY